MSLFTSYWTPGSREWTADRDAHLKRHGLDSNGDQSEATVDAILASDTGDDTIIHRLATRAREMETLAKSLMRVLQKAGFGE